MTLKPDSRFPSRRAYVVKLPSDVGPEDLTGRLENLVMGVQLEFGSGREPVDSIASDLLATGIDAIASPRST